MRIGILGSGDVGQALGLGFATLGHEVKIGTREPGSEKLAAWARKAGAKASVGTFAEAAAFAQLAFLATSWGGAENALKLAGPENLAGKVVVDVTNPLDFSQGTPPRLAVGFDDSAGERVQRWLPRSRVVKAFNIIGNAHMFRPRFAGGPPDMFLCGDDEAAKTEVTGFLTDFGWNTIDLGGIAAARLLEPLALVWITHAFRTGTWDHAFKLLRK